jgi:tetratricopeptide (TPR) repeat protein
LALLFATGLAGAAAAAGTPAAKAEGVAEFRAAWVAFAAPAADPKQSQSLEARQASRLAAIPHMEAAVAAAPRNPEYQGDLTYICLTAGQYEKARAAVNQAIAVRRNEPLLYLLRGQAEAALAEMDPPTAGDNIGPALTAFDRAAHLDHANSLPLLQGASVAFDVNRPKLALARVKRALERRGARLYALWLPTNLDPDRGASLRTWQYVQLGHWFELLARCRNVHRSLLKLGIDAEQTDDLKQAEERFRQALEVARQVAAMQPNLFITVATGLDLMEDAYSALSGSAAESLIGAEFARLNQPGGPPQQALPAWPDRAKAVIEAQFTKQKLTEAQRKQLFAEWRGMEPAPSGLDDPRWDLVLLASYYSWLLAREGAPRTEEAQNLERWQGEAGVVRFARSQLAPSLQAYVQEITKGPPPKIQELLAKEAAYVAPVIKGIGLKAQEEPPTAAETKPVAVGGR